MDYILDFVVKYFWLFFILGILSGAFWTSSLFITPAILYLMMFNLFLVCLKINTKNFFEKIKDFKTMAYLSFLILVLIPLLIYPFFNFFLKAEYGLAILILLLMPTGMAVPAYAVIFKGDKELALALSVVTSLLCPLTIPIMIYLLTGLETGLSFPQMFITLSIVIFAPFLASLIFKKIKGQLVKKTEKFYSPLSIIIVSFIMAGAIAKVDLFSIIGQNNQIVYPFLSLFLLAIILHLIGYFAVAQKNISVKITSSLALAYMNSTLAIVFASQFFGPETLLLVILYQIPTNLVLIGFGFWIKKWNAGRYSNAPRLC